MDGDKNILDGDVNKSMTSHMTHTSVDLSEPGTTDKRKIEEVADAHIDEVEDRHRKKKKKSKDRERKHKDKDRDRDRDREKDKERGERGDRDRDREREKEEDRSERKKKDHHDVKSEEIKKESTKHDSKTATTEVSEKPKSERKESSSVDEASDRRREREREDSRRPIAIARTDRSGEDLRRERERSPDRRRDRSEDRRRREDSRGRGREDRRYRERERSRSRDRSYGRRERSRSDSRSRHRRRRSPSDSRDYRRRRRSSSERRVRKLSDKERERDPIGHKKEEDKNETSTLKPISLKDVISANPGISMPEAVARLNAYNSALAKGEVPPPISGSSQQSLGFPSSMMNVAMGTTFGEGGALTKPHRELYVGNLPPAITVPQLTEFLNAAMKQAGFAKENVNSVITAWVSPDGHYAFVEMRSVEEATAALNYLNGIQIGIYSLKIGRPKGYSGQPPTGLTIPALGLGATGLSSLSASVLPGVGLNTALPGMGLGIGMEPLSNVIMASNLPTLINEEQVKELFTPFGELKAFNIIKTASGQTQSAVFEFVDPAITDGVVNGMNKLDIAGNKLSVQRVPLSSASLLLKPTNSSPKASDTTNSATTALSNGDQLEPELQNIPPTTVLRLSNMTTDEDLIDDSLYEELIEDVAEECNRHGTVKSIIVPRKPSDEHDQSVGRIFVHFTHSDGAKKALAAIAGRKFNGKIVQAVYFPERLFVSKIYNVPHGYDDNAIAKATAKPTNSDLD